MPEIFRIGGFRFFFYANEGNPREPPHVHVEQGEAGSDGLSARPPSAARRNFWLRPNVRVAYNDGFDARTLRRLLELLEANRIQLETAWNDFFS